MSPGFQWRVGPAPPCDRRDVRQSALPHRPGGGGEGRSARSCEAGYDRLGWPGRGGPDRQRYQWPRRPPVCSGLEQIRGPAGYRGFRAGQHRAGRVDRRRRGCITFLQPAHTPPHPTPNPPTPHPSRPLTLPPPARNVGPPAPVDWQQVLFVSAVWAQPSAGAHRRPVATPSPPLHHGSGRPSSSCRPAHMTVPSSTSRASSCYRAPQPTPGLRQPIATRLPFRATLFPHPLPPFLLPSISSSFHLFLPSISSFLSPTAAGASSGLSRRSF